jgi:hypothetical protein
MATIGNGPNGYRRILFLAGDGGRRTIRLGKRGSGQFLLGFLHRRAFIRPDDCIEP